jgi:hypothetical protein
MGASHQPHDDETFRCGVFGQNATKESPDVGTSDLAPFCSATSHRVQFSSNEICPKRKKPTRTRRASALAECFTWPQVALNRHGFSIVPFLLYYCPKRLWASDFGRW